MSSCARQNCQSRNDAGEAFTFLFYLGKNIQKTKKYWIKPKFFQISSDIIDTRIKRRKVFQAYKCLARQNCYRASGGREISVLHYIII